MIYKLHSGLECLKCGDKIYSLFRHDYKRCKCGACFVDGGLDYFRYGFEKVEEITIIRCKVYPIKNSRNWSFKPNQVANKKTIRQREDALMIYLLELFGIDNPDKKTMDKRKKIK